jgi:hypothetical protein
VLLLPDGDEPSAAIDGGATSISAAEVAATHTPAASRSVRRDGQVARVPDPPRGQRPQVWCRCRSP